MSALRRQASLLLALAAVVVTGACMAVDDERQSAPPTTLKSLQTDRAYTVRALAPNADCLLGYSAGSTPALNEPRAAPPAGAVLHDAAELALWRLRVQRIRAGEPVRTARAIDDWRRIEANAAAFLAVGELSLSDVRIDPRRGHGERVRDAAFVYRMVGGAARLKAVRDHLIAMATDARNDFTAQCATSRDPAAAPFHFFAFAPWFARLVATYDLVRSDLAAPDRLLIERYLIRQAHYMAAYVDEGLAKSFPARLDGDYAQRANDAAPRSAEATWWKQRSDTNGDCRIDEQDAPEAAAAHAYVRRDGSLGPRLSVLGQWWNNRSGSLVLASGLVGLTLGEPQLVARAKRYLMEWLTYGVYPDGSDGEFARNGDYCLPNAGVIYQHGNLQATLLLARALLLQGDRSLQTFNTCDGLFGTEDADCAAPKSLATPLRMQLDLLRGRLDWYAHERSAPDQRPREATRLQRLELRFMNRGAPADDSHELGLLWGAALFPELPVTPVILRDPAWITLRAPGSTGLPVDPGWTDGFGVYPAVYLLVP